MNAFTFSLHSFISIMFEMRHSNWFNLQKRNKTHTAEGSFILMVSTHRIYKIKVATAAVTVVIVTGDFCCNAQSTVMECVKFITIILIIAAIMQNSGSYFFLAFFLLNSMF